MESQVSIQLLGRISVVQLFSHKHVVNIHCTLMLLLYIKRSISLIRDVFGLHVCFAGTLCTSFCKSWLDYGFIFKDVLVHKFCTHNAYIKDTLSVISSDPPSKDGDDRFTTVPWNLNLSENGMIFLFPWFLIFISLSWVYYCLFLIDIFVFWVY